MADWFGKDVFKLGFGMMRLPKDENGKNDTQKVCEMVDRFIQAGGTYFDTAYAYDNGDSERVVKEALVDRYPRDKFTLCTKINSWDEKEIHQQFYTSLERTGAQYFDYYLLHAIQRSNYKKYDEYHLWDFVKEQKAKGLIKYYGFSFHADPELLEELLCEHPDVDFIQLQINYADWDNPGIASRECYEIARRHGVSFTIMEPVKGGVLANPPEDVKKIFDEANDKMSYASWAIRYAASFEGVITVLSGMSNMEQVEDNLSYMTDFHPLTEQEYEVISRAQTALLNDRSIKCTSCHYCTEVCPMGIGIPEIFAVKNTESHTWDGGKQAYAIATMGKGRASACIECGRCESICPQHLSVISILKDCLSME